MRITVLTYLEAEGSRESDAVVGQVARVLKGAGHEVSTLGIHADPRKFIGGLLRRKPDLVFNLAEMFRNDLHGEVAVAGTLELLGIPYTGSGPGELYLQEDKGLAKKLLEFERIRYPNFAVFARDAGLETGGNLHMPLFVKPLRSDGSVGIDKDSLVTNSRDLMARVVSIHEKQKDAALAEEYIEGREFYVGILGNYEPVALPPIEMDFSGLAEGAPKILSSRAKWDRRSAEYKGTKAIIPELQDSLRAQLHRIALDAYRALRVRDYGRVDLRLTDTGDVYVIEVNANCYLEESSEFVMAARAAGIEYADLIGRIAESAMERGGRSAAASR